MQLASTIRLQIETALAHKVPSALTPTQKIIRPVASTGVAAVDELLDGGLPIGAITEMTGPESSGRTSLALSYIARATHEGKICAWIDVSDALHAESAAAIGVDLSRLLWVRCGATAPPKHSAKYQFALSEKYFVTSSIKRGFGSHPRNETKGLSDAVVDLLKPEAIGPRSVEPQPRRQPEQKKIELNLCPHQQRTRLRTRPGKPWSRIEQALASTDLLLQGGGFSAIVIDMGGVAPEYISRIELSIWFRYRAAVDKTQASLLLLTQHPCAKSAGELLLRFHPGEARHDERTVFTGIEHCLEVERQRFAPTVSNVVPLKKQPQRRSVAHWKSQSIWTGAR